MSSVTSLRPNHNVDDRACAAIRTLAGTLDELNAIRTEDPTALMFFLMELDKAGDDIALLRAALRMKRTTTQLCNQFGRSP
jgi:hypothetical protein